jgi:hypothetical protein
MIAGIFRRSVPDVELLLRAFRQHLVALVEPSRSDLLCTGLRRGCSGQGCAPATLAGYDGLLPCAGAAYRPMA